MRRHSRSPLPSRRSALIAAAWLGVGVAGGSHAAPDGFVAQPRASYQYSGVPPMRMPTDVAVTSDGTVYAADGVNDRVLCFAPDGTFLRAIVEAGERRLARPVGLGVDATGRLWVADAGNRRLLAFSGSDQALHEIGFADDALAHPPDITDVAAAPDARFVWVVDNDNHRLVRVELEGGVRAAFGSEGEALGQLHFPFMIAAAEDGAVFVSDVINGRVASFNADGRPSAGVGTFGVEPGQLYRPKGVAVDRAGNVWVADGSMGVIQVFARTGALIDVLRDETGGPARFESPAGIAFDERGNLYVAEVGADRIRSFQIVGAPARAAEPRRSEPAQLTGQQARSCTICHIEWMESFQSRSPTALVPAPEDTPAQPAVSRAATCLSCHDGSVVDSRRRVWSEHGHRTDVEPPPGMRVPPALPLVDGRVACRTCHSAHATGEPTGDIRTAVFLRVENRASELCMSCHVEHTRGPELGTHPTGGMPWPVPQELIAAGAKVGPNPRELTCQVCHTPHGSSFEHLLVMGVESNQLCLSCHDQMRPGMFREGDHTEHPLSPVVNAEQRAAIERLDTRIGPGERLICLSCHRLHHGKGQRFMLAAELTDGQMCLSCHSDKSAVVDTAHDLRTNRPNEVNRLGMTPAVGGPCSACHLFHRYARPPEFSEIDPRGHCITCHQPGRCAESRMLGTVNHPQIRCEQCHNPHTDRHGPFLAARPTDLCTACHSNEAALLGGPHDLTTGTAAWPGDSQNAADECLACHRPHGDAESGLFRIPPAAGVSAFDAACLSCHSEASWTSQGPHALVHTRAVEGLAADHGLPLKDSDAGRDRIGCATCHDPHASAHAGEYLLRALPDQPSESLCFRCHTQTAHIELTGHSASARSAAGLESAGCRPCHTIHADPGAIEASLLWPVALRAPATTQPAPPAPAADGTTAPARMPSDDPHCVACHRVGGAAPLPAVTWHPQFPMQQMVADEAEHVFPLFDERGMPDPFGRITCRTCHLSHGRLPQGERSVLDLASAFGFQKPAWLGLHLRPFRTPNVCTSCHGEDALRRMLYFHDPLRRTGPLETSPPAP